MNAVHTADERLTHEVVRVMRGVSDDNLAAVLDELAVPAKGDKLSAHCVCFCFLSGRVEALRKLGDAALLVLARLLSVPSPHLLYFYLVIFLFIIPIGFERRAEHRALSLPGVAQLRFLSARHCSAFPSLIPLSSEPLDQFHVCLNVFQVRL